MTLFTGKQVFPVNYEAEVSQRLLEALNIGDFESALECINDPFVDVNYIGAVWLKVRKTEVDLREELASEVRVEYEEFKTDVTALFLAVHGGNVSLVRHLLSMGADVNQKLFRGFATTAAVREGQFEILQILLKAGASQLACEEAILEASCHGQARLTELLMGSDLIRRDAAVHALFTACCRGFFDVADSLLKCGVNANAFDRVLLQSAKPSIHTNVDCTALAAAVVSRQVSIVRLLLQAGAKTDIKVKLGAWSWDESSGEEFRVGAGLADPYPITWCAVEYFEFSGTILRMLLHQQSLPFAPHHGRTLLHHAILCNNTKAVDILLNNCGADIESPVQITGNVEFRAIHMAARLGLSSILHRLIESRCDLNSTTDSGSTALMICAKYKREECFKILAKAGADFGLLDNSGQSAVQTISGSTRWVLDLIRTGYVPKSSNLSVFSPLIFVARSGDIQVLKLLIERSEIKLDHQDQNGFSAVMITALEGHVEAFRSLVFAGVEVSESAITLSELNQNRYLFEKVMLEYALKKGIKKFKGFYALHCASRRGDLKAIALLILKGYKVNSLDKDDYTPLMLAAREGHGPACALLILRGANCEMKNARGETVLSLARKNKQTEAETVILNHLARELVLLGAQVTKHTKGGKGTPHRKDMRMVAATGVLRWGQSCRKNVVCKEAEVGASSSFLKNRLRKGEFIEPGLFRVVTCTHKEVHFVCEGGVEMAELWVRGIKLVTGGGK